jgi:hypothetical protein
VETLHAGGWTVEAVWLDLDGRGERAWHRTVDPWGGERWCTTPQLQELLHRHGLDVGDLTMREPVRITDRGDDCK